MFYFMWDLMAGSLSTLPSLLLVAASWLSIQISELITVRARGETLQALLERLDDAVYTAVREVEQVLVVPYKKASRRDTLGAAEREAASARAAQTARACLGARGWFELGAALGLSNDELERSLSGRIEAAVYDLRGPFPLVASRYGAGSRPAKGDRIALVFWESDARHGFGDRRGHAGAAAISINS